MQVCAAGSRMIPLAWRIVGALRRGCSEAIAVHIDPDADRTLRSVTNGCLRKRAPPPDNRVIAKHPTAAGRRLGGAGE